MKHIAIRAALLSVTYLTMTVSAHAQLLPDIGDSIDTPITRDIEKSIEDSIDDRINEGVDEQVESNVENVISQLDDLNFDDDFEIDLDTAFEPILDVSDEIGNVIDQTDAFIDQNISDIARIPSSELPIRNIELDTDNGLPVIKNEWLVMLPNDGVEGLEALNLSILEKTELQSSAQTLFVVSFSQTVQETTVLEGKLSSLGADIFDRNHVFKKATKPLLNETPEAPKDTKASKNTPSQNIPQPTRRSKLGLIDTDVDSTHPAFTNTTILEKDFVAYGNLRPLKHGTAVASILMRESQPTLPKDTALFAASVFFLSEDGTTGAAASSIVQAIDWLVAQGVTVINISLTGPPNKTMESYIAQMQQQGIIFVAAVGNEGPASAPLYPAAYEGVIGVTAVNEAGNVYRWANRGQYVDVAALGVNVQVARPGGQQLQDSGTSFAAPIVSAFLANPPNTDAQTDIEASAESRLRLALHSHSDHSRDDILGYGILDTAATKNGM